MSAPERTYPAFPIPSVGAVILNREHILLVQRGQPPSAGKWTFPGGIVELGESPEHAIIREVKEECHIDIAVLGVIDVVNRVFRDEKNAIKYHYVIIDYLARCLDESDRPKQGSLLPATDVLDARWIPLQEVLHYELTEGLLSIIRAGIAKHTQWNQF